MVGFKVLVAFADEAEGVVDADGSPPFRGRRDAQSALSFELGRRTRVPCRGRGHLEDDRNLSTSLGQFFVRVVESVGSGLLIQVVPGRFGGSGCLRTNLSGFVA